MLLKNFSLTFCSFPSDKNASSVVFEFSAKSCGCFLRQQKPPFREDDELDETDFYDDDFDASWQQQ